MSLYIRSTTYSPYTCTRLYSYCLLLYILYITYVHTYTHIQVDFFDTGLDQDALLQRARLEAEEVVLQDEEEQQKENQDEYDRLMHKKAKKKGKMQLSREANKGNFSNFRNKTFVPNYTRSAAVAAPSTTTAPAHTHAHDEDDEEDEVDEVVNELPVNRKKAAAAPEGYGGNAIAVGFQALDDEDEGDDEEEEGDESDE